MKTRSASGLLMFCVCMASVAEPWQNITQPIGTLLVRPPETALAVNQYLMSLDPNITPATYPFDLRTDVTKIQTSQMLYFVRVYNDASGSRPVGSWVMRASEARGLSPKQIRNIQALPAVPTDFTLVKVPAGIVLYTGVAGAIDGWGEGGATQSKMMGPPFVPVDNFINRQPIGDCLLCYQQLAPVGNAHRLAAVLDRNTPVPYSSLDSLYDNLDRVYAPSSIRQFNQALNALSGEGATASQSVVLGNAASFIESIRLNTAGWLTARPGSEPFGTARRAVGWASLSGSTAILRGQSGAATVNTSGASLQLGVNRRLSEAFTLGVAIGAVNSSYSLNDRASNGTVNGLNLAVVGLTRWGNAYLAGTLAYGVANTSLSRDVQVNELVGQFQGRFVSQTLTTRVELGYQARLARLTLTPFVSIEPTWLWQGGSSESARTTTPNSVNLGLAYQAQQITSWPASLGLQLDGVESTHNDWTWKPTLRLAWIHNFSVQRQVDASLQLLPGQPFTVFGASAPRDVGRVLLGLTGRHATGVSGYLAIDALVSGQSQAIGVRGGLAIPF